MKKSDQIAVIDPVTPYKFVAYGGNLIEVLYDCLFVVSHVLLTIFVAIKSV